jgi:hypothetical protein
VRVATPCAQATVDMQSFVGICDRSVGRGRGLGIAEMFSGIHLLQLQLWLISGGGNDIQASHKMQRK